MTDCGPDPGQTQTGRLGSLGAWCARHWLTVLALWIALLVAAVAGSDALGGVYSDTLTIPGSAAQHGLDVLRAYDAKAGGQGGEVVFVDRAGVAAQRTALEQARTNLEHLPHVLSVSDPLGAGAVSRSGTTAYASINFNTNPQGLGSSYVGEVNAAVAVARRAGAAVSYGGALGQAAAPKANDAASELIGIAVALAVLLIGFGSALGALLPLAGAIVGVFAGLGLLGALAAAISFGTSAPTLATMIGLGVGIDYALFLTTRYRQRLIEGDGVAHSIRATLDGSGRSVLIAATTVVLAMCGLYACGITFIGKLGLAAAITVAVAALAALSLGPALLGLAAAAIDRLHVRRPVAEPSDPNGALHRYTEMLERHPWRWATSGIALLAVIAVPMLSMRLGHVGPGAEPQSWSERQAYDAISAGFGPGANGPFTIVAQLSATVTSQQRDSLASTLASELAAIPGVASVSPLQPAGGGKLLARP